MLEFGIEDLPNKEAESGGISSLGPGLFSPATEFGPSVSKDCEKSNSCDRSDSLSLLATGLCSVSGFGLSVISDGPFLRLIFKPSSRSLQIVFSSKPKTNFTTFEEEKGQNISAQRIIYLNSYCSCFSVNTLL